MAYFDSPKNRAMWEKEKIRLKRERESRKKEGFAMPDECWESADQPVEVIAGRELISSQKLQEEQDRGDIVCG